MSIKTNELQQMQSILGTDSLLVDSLTAGTGRVSLAKAAEFFGAELVKPANPVGAALSNKAALSVQQTVEATSVPSRTVEVAAAELPGYINSLPRLLTEHLTVMVTGTAAISSLWLKGFYGSGSLTVQAAEGAEITVQVTARVEYCSVPITFDGLKIIGNGSMAGSILSAGYGSFLTVRNCEIDREHDRGESGAAATGASRLFLEHCRITYCSPALNCLDASILSAVDCVGQNNNRGIYAQGGIVLLRGTTPDLMGGNANTKGGGLIVKSDGTLL